jgi:spore germination protein KA
MLAVGEARSAKDFDDAVFACLLGDCIMFVDGLADCIIIGAKGYDKRAIKPSDTEMSVRGPKESFIETLRTNTALVRRRIKNPELCFENLVVGRQTKTPVSVVYMHNIADEKLVKEVRRRLKSIDIDSIMSSGYVEQLIEDEPTSVFSTVGFTERPDVLCAKLMEGRVGVIVDGTHYALTIPYFFIENFQTPEDYSNNFISVSLIRFFRYAAFFISTLAPAIYVALVTFHHEMIPTSLLLTMSAAREGIPFSAFFEAFFMIIVFEILKEAGVRLPQPIGQTISIVGALVMGEAAVSAGFVSAPLVIVIAFTAVSGFVVSSLSSPVLILRFVFLFLAGFLGGYGIAVGIIVLIVRLADIESFGYRYLSPVIPFNIRDQKDTLVRAPLWMMRTRPHLLARKNRVRENNPIPPDDN